MLLQNVTPEGASFPLGLTHVRHFLYVADSYSGLFTYDISDPRAPKFIKNDSSSINLKKFVVGDKIAKVCSR